MTSTHGSLAPTCWHFRDIEGFSIFENLPAARFVRSTLPTRILLFMIRANKCWNGKTHPALQTKLLLRDPATRLFTMKNKRFLLALRKSGA